MTAIDRGLPDPDHDRDLYDGVAVKRLLAWIVDVILIGLITLLTLPLTFFTALFFLPVFYLCIGFVYRWMTIANGSATLGMRLAAIEFRNGWGARFDAGEALLHTAGYTLSVCVFPLQFLSGALMLGTSRGQGLTDLVMGSTAINRPS